MMSVQIRTILGSKIGGCMCRDPDNFGPLMDVCVRVRTILERQAQVRGVETALRTSNITDCISQSC